MPVSGSNGYRSGIVTLPNRVRLREMDSRLGMYPTISRMGDKDRKGNKTLKPYNDNDSHIFIETYSEVPSYDLTKNQIHVKPRSNFLNINYASSNNLKLLFQFTPTNPTELAAASDIASLVYESTGGFSAPVPELRDIGENQYYGVYNHSAYSRQTKITFDSNDNSSSFDNKSFTFSFWYYRSSSSNVADVFINKAGEYKIELSFGYFYVRLYDSSSNQYLVYFDLANGTFDNTAVDDVLYFYTVTYDNTTESIRLFIDGIEYDPDGITKPANWSGLSQQTNELIFGPGRGWIHEVSMWDKVLTKKEITSIIDLTKINFNIRTGLNYPIVNLGSLTLSSSQNLNHKLLYATPNTPHISLSVSGSTIREITDNPYLTDYKELTNRNLTEESLSPFDDHRVELKDSLFYNEGTNPESFPGFDSRLLDKTQIVFDLTTKEQTTFGYTEKSTKFDKLYSSYLAFDGDDSFDLTDLKQQLMIYWNKSLNRWEKIARGVSANSHPTGTFNSNDLTVNFYKKLGEMVDQAAVGFSPCIGQVAIGKPRPDVGSGYSSYPLDTLPENFIKTFGKPTANYGFPNHGKYHATGSQLIKMSDYIDRPFLLEKLNLKFDAKFEFAGTNATGMNAFAAKYTDFYFNGDHGGIIGDKPRILSNLGVVYVMPTFFILRQSKNQKRDYVHDFNFASNGLDNVGDNYSQNNKFNTYKKYFNYLKNQSASGSFLDSDLSTLDYSIPGNFYLNSGSDNLTYVDTDRELITFGQLGLLMSGSVERIVNIDLAKKLPGDTKYSMMTEDYFSKVNGEYFSNYIYSSIPALTKSFSLDFKSRVIPPIKERPGETFFYHTGSSTKTRGYSDITNAGVKDNTHGTGRMMHRWYGGRSLPVNIIQSSSPVSGTAEVVHLKNSGRGLIRNSTEYIIDNSPGSISKLIFSTAGERTDNSYLTASAQLVEKRYNKLELLDLDSPYILFPEDELIFGWQYPISEINNACMPSEDTVLRNMMTLDGPASLTMFGSQVRNNQEFHDTLNQPLTSEGIHESLHHDNPVIDQYLISERQNYSGSYLDNFATGSIGSGIRSLIGTDENVLSGSFQRFVKCNNIKDRYYDTLVPSIGEMYIIDGHPKETAAHRVDRFATVAAGTVPPFISIGIGESYNQKWNYLFPFEKRFAGLERVTKDNVYIEVMDIVSGSGAVTTAIQPVVIAADAFPPSPFNGFRVHNNPITYKHILWGFGSGGRGLFKQVGLNPQATFQNGGFNLERQRGWKYGLWNGFKETTCAIYRPDRFTGQYADIMQQQYDTRFFDEKTNTLSEPPIKIKFVLPDDEKEVYLVLDETESTANTFESSNISIYATSSLPYFDDGTAPHNRVYSNLPNRVIEIEV